MTPSLVELTACLIGLPFDPKRRNNVTSLTPRLLGNPSRRRPARPGCGEHLERRGQQLLVHAGIDAPASAAVPRPSSSCHGSVTGITQSRYRDRGVIASACLHTYRTQI